MLLCRPTNVTTAINLQALRLSFLLSSLRRNPKLDRQECPVCPRAVSKLSNTPVDFPYIQLASSININDRFDGHKNTDVGLFVLRQPAVVVHDLIKLTTVDLASITRLWQCLSLKLKRWKAYLSTSDGCEGSWSAEQQSEWGKMIRIDGNLYSAFLALLP